MQKCKNFFTSASHLPSITKQLCFAASIFAFAKVIWVHCSIFFTTFHTFIKPEQNQGQYKYLKINQEKIFQFYF